MGKFLLFKINTPILILDVFMLKYFILSSQNDAQTCSTSERSGKNIRVKNPTKILSTGFCLKVCSLLLEHIDEGISCFYKNYFQRFYTYLTKNRIVVDFRQTSLGVHRTFVYVNG